MPRQYLSHTIYDFAVHLAMANRLFTLAQVGRHPLLADRALPAKHASNALSYYSTSFIRTPWQLGEPHRFALSKEAREAREVKDHPIAGDSQHAPHWLALGDLWLTLTFASTDCEAWKQTGKYKAPTIWITEPGGSAGFDVFAVWEGWAYLFEVQLSKLPANRWRDKWKKRVEWFEKEQWRTAPWQRSDRLVKPRAVLVTLTGQQAATMQVPNFVIVAKSMEEVPTLLRREKEN